MPLAAVELAVDTDTLLYTCPSGKEGSVNVSFCAKTAGPASIRLALTSGGAPAVTDYLEYGATIGIGGVAERTGVWISDGEKLYGRANTTGVTVIVMGPVKNITA